MKSYKGIWINTFNFSLILFLNIKIYITFLVIFFVYVIGFESYGIYWLSNICATDEDITECVSA